MPEWYGWAGTILRVNLTDKTVKKEPLPEYLATQFIGGRGFNSKILFDHLRPGVDPFSPENLLIFGAGPCTGTLIPCSGRFTISTKSPVTGGLGDANSGGHFGPQMKWAGYDMIIFEGKAEKPVYVWIEDDNVEIRDAEHLWGLDTWITTNEIIKDVGDPSISVACIGPAGENMVASAAIINEYARAAAKCGVGAVMGSKKLKAVAVRGTKGIRVADPKGVVDVYFKYVRILKEEDEWWYNNFSKYGTPMFVDQYQGLGALPTYNWSEGVFEKADELGVEKLYPKYVKKKRSCFACVLHCSPFILIEEGPYAGFTGEGVEYEAFTGFGSKIGCANIELVLAAGTMCDRYGIDYISCAEVIAWAFECYNRGILTKEDTDGLDLTWGNEDVVLELIRRLAYREGKIGELLALGSRKAAQKIGKGAEYYSMTIKGQQPGSMDPRVLAAWGFSYAVGNRGGDHLRTHLVCEYMFTPEEMEKYVGTAAASDRFGWHVAKADLVVWSENMRTISNCMEHCTYFNRGAPRLYVEFPVDALRAVTGLDWTYEKLVECAHRIITLERAFNVREGFSRKDDYLPERFYKEPLTKGPGRGKVVPRDHWEKLLDRYYTLRGWDTKTGWPTRETLEKLGLKYVADQLEELGKLPGKGA